MIRIKLREQKESCPSATQDSEENSKNRQEAIEDPEIKYGPIEESVEEFWIKKSEKWEVSIEEAKEKLCGNCGAFDVSQKMKDCIAKGLEKDDKDVSLAEELGYCKMYKFKCAASRTCDSWVDGGPIT